MVLCDPFNYSMKWRPGDMRVCNNECSTALRCYLISIFCMYTKIKINNCEKRSLIIRNSSIIQPSGRARDEKEDISIFSDVNIAYLVTKLSGFSGI